MKIQITCLPNTDSPICRAHFHSQFIVFTSQIYALINNGTCVQKLGCKGNVKYCGPSELYESFQLSFNSFTDTELMDRREPDEYIYIRVNSVV